MRCNVITPTNYQNIQDSILNLIELSQPIEAYCLFLMLQSNFGFQYLILLCPNYGLSFFVCRKFLWSNNLQLSYNPQLSKIISYIPSTKQLISFMLVFEDLLCTKNHIWTTTFFASVEKYFETLWNFDYGISLI